MSNTELFNSKTAPIPEIRQDLQIIPVEQNGDTYLYFHDEWGYATPELAIHRQTGPLLSLIDGQKSIEDLAPRLGNGVDKDDVLEFVRFLDKNRLLNSRYMQRHAEKTEENYEQSRVHHSVTAGSSYPADPGELKEYLDAVFEKHKPNESDTVDNAKALYAPHIDPRVAIDSYVKAFAPIKDLKPKRVVILATSHYAGFYPDVYRETPFMLVNKDFELPLGTIKRDRKSIEKLKSGEGITVRDRAHRMEHSIELHLLFLSYIWDHEFKILPFLTRGLDDIYYMEDGHLGQQLQDFAAQLNALYAQDDDTFFLVSGDLAHFGKKFGDPCPASHMFGEVKQFDHKFLDYGSKAKRKQLLELMKEDMDPFRICGFPPLYTFLQIMPQLSGKILGYDLWDERERESAVTFGSILYQRNGESG